MGSHTIIAINREYGSNGRIVGLEVARKLGIPSHGDDIVGLASQYSGIDEDFFKKIDERPTDSFLFMLANNAFTIGSSIGAYQSSLSSDMLFTKQSEVIRKFAEDGDCVILGRCGNYILRDEPGLISVFITADDEFKIKTVMEREEVDRREAIKRVRTMNRRRANYYGYYSGREWGACKTYDFMVNTGKLGIETAVDVICNYVEIVKSRRGQMEERGND